MKKLKMISSGTDNNRVFFIVEKNNSFFDLFPMFLVSCGFSNIGVFGQYQMTRPEIHRIYNKLDRFWNEEYDIDLVFGSDKIFVLVRTDEGNREMLVDSFRKIAEFRV